MAGHSCVSTAVLFAYQLNGGPTVEKIEILIKLHRGTGRRGKNLSESGRVIFLRGSEQERLHEILLS